MHGFPFLGGIFPSVRGWQGKSYQWYKRAMKKIVPPMIIVILVFLSACSPAATPTAIPDALPIALEATEVNVLIQELMLDPAEIVIHAGTTVTWFNLDAARHMVNANSGEFDSPTLLFGDSFSFTFDTPGEYRYFNKYHVDIKGKVIVVP